MKIKLCGMMRECDIAFANEAKPDYVGFIFANTRRKISKEQAITFKNALASDIKAVGVFVDEDVDIVADLANCGAMDIIQLHGKEDALYIEELKKKVDNNIEIFKAVRVKEASQIVEAAKLDVNALLLDTYRKGILGGTGECFDWEIITEARKLSGCADEAGYICGKPFFMAGGIDVDNFEQAMKSNPFGLDISSGIETDGQKDKDKMIEIVRRIRNV